MQKNYFITGTDTDSGKTLVAAAMLHKASLTGLKTVGLKPIAAGAEEVDGVLKNQDAILLQNNASVHLPYAQVNPVVFAEPMAPHIAAERESRQVTVSQLEGFARGVLMQSADIRIIEGAGGWLVPVNRREPLSELPKRLKCDVIVVVGMKLGCINHAMLSVAQIQRDGLRIAGWVANRIDEDMLCYDENFSTLEQIIPAPCLGEIPRLKVDASLSALSSEQSLLEQAADFLTLPNQL